MAYNFEKLECWKNARELAILVYDACDNYPKHEQFSLTSQSTRAVVSVAANIAEGSSRSSKKDFCHFLEIALGSAFELETLFEISLARKYIEIANKNDLSNLLELVVK